MEVVGDGDTDKITYSGQWSSVNNSGATDGTVHSSSDPSASIRLVFLGTFIQIDALRSPTGGNFTVLLDGSLFGPYSLYSPNTTTSNVWSQTNLSPSATHTVEMRRVQATTGLDDVHSINVDSFRVSAVATPSPTSTSSRSTSTSTSSTSSSNTSSTSSRSSTTRTNSTSSTSTSTHTVFTLPSPASSTTHPGTSAAATETPASSGPNRNKAGVIIGSISAFVIVTSLLVILVVAVRRRLAKRTEGSLRPKTTPAYQTTSTQRMTGAPLAPLGVYNRYPSPNSTSSQVVSRGLYNDTTGYGFGSNSHHALSPVARTVSSPNNIGAGGGSAEDRPISSVEESSSNAHYVFQPASAMDDSRGPGYAESVASDYPYTLTFQSPRAY